MYALRSFSFIFLFDFFEMFGRINLNAKLKHGKNQDDNILDR